MQFKAFLISLRTSLWPVPMLMIGGAALLAYVCIGIDGDSTHKLGDTYPQPFAGGADSLRIMLSAIATSMITVSGITFSLTISSLANVSGQLTARVIQSFMSNLVTKLVLGFFVGLFVYCIIVVRTIRIKDDPGGAFVPALSVFMGMADRQLALRVDATTGDYVTMGSRLVSVVGAPQRVDSEVTKQINRLFIIRPSRTLDQEIAYGIRQLVDVGLKVLSPASDDTTTAILVLDNLTTVLGSLVQRQLRSPLATDYFIPKHPLFSDVMAGALDQIREAAGKDRNTVVLARMLWLLMVVGRQTGNAGRQEVLRHHTQLIAEQASMALTTDYQRGVVQQQLAETLLALEVA